MSSTVQPQPSIPKQLSCWDPSEPLYSAFKADCIEPERSLRVIFDKFLWWHQICHSVQSLILIMCIENIKTGSWEVKRLHDLQYSSLGPHKLLYFIVGHISTLSYHFVYGMRILFLHESLSVSPFSLMLTPLANGHTHESHINNFTRYICLPTNIQWM